MVQELTRRSQAPTPDSTLCPPTDLAAHSVFYRIYSRKHDGVRESWPEVGYRAVRGLVILGNFAPKAANMIRCNQRQIHIRTLGIGPGLAVLNGPTALKTLSEPITAPAPNADDWQTFGLMRDLTTIGCMPTSSLHLTSLHIAGTFEP